MLTTYTVDRQVRDYLETAPNPEVMEEKTAVLREGLMGLGTRSLLALRVPREWKGQAIGQGDYFCFQETLAKHSGTLAFTQIQHQTAGSFIANGDNENLKSEYLPDMGGGRVLVGVGYSHLRRQGKPVLTAKPVSGGYHISGNIPWITGLNLFQEAVIAARLEDDRILFAILPLSPSADGKLHFSAPMSLASMSATNTVSAECDRYFIPAEKTISIRPKDWMQKKDRQSILNATCFLLGCARSGLNLVENASKTQPEIADSFLVLNEALNDCRQNILAALERDDLSAEQQVELRARAIALTHQCSLAAVAVSRGAANQKYHPAQRIYREALVFTVTGQTNAVMSATLKQISSLNL